MAVLTRSSPVAWTTVLPVVALIVTLVVSGGPETATLARDTVFAAVVITCNGIVGLSLLLGLGFTQMVLLALTVVGALTVVPGRATRLRGAVHLVLPAGLSSLAVTP